VRIYITGIRGQLGAALRLGLDGHTVEGGDLPDWDMIDRGQVLETFEAFRPDAVVHAAALTAVDYCAEHPREAVRINGVGTYNVAAAAEAVGALLVAISTNEVFDGQAQAPYQEYDQRRPINAYGYSKFVAERVIEKLVSRYMIVRTAWLYAQGGTNFIHKMLARARAGKVSQVVTDEVSSPTCAADLADGLRALIETGCTGFYHLVNEGACSRFEFAQEAVRLAGLDEELIAPTTMADYVRASTPPPYAPLDNVFAAALGVRLRPWQDALAAFVGEYDWGDGGAAG
jgi:dTDP-4-dehydrorhamnose reductase